MPITVTVRGPRIFAGAEPLGRITFDAPRIVIGRAASCDVRLADESVSLRHLTIRQRGAEYVVVDEGSTNGTRSGREKLTAHAQHPVGRRAELRVGRFTLELEVGVEAVTQQPAAAAKQIAIATVVARLRSEGEDACPVVRVDEGPDSGTTLELPLDKRVTLGRSRDAGLVLADVDASRRHAEIVWRGDAIFARDLGSKSGTSLADRALGSSDAPWRSGEALRIGGTILSLSFEAPSALEEIERAPDERLDASELELDRAAVPAASSEEEAESDGDDTVEGVGEAEHGRPEVEPEPSRPHAAASGGGWGVTDIAVVLLAVGVFSLSAVGYVVLLR